MNRVLSTLALLLLTTSAQAVMDVPSQGWDGALNITTNTTIDLSQAFTGQWNTQPAGYVVGKGIYDGQKWAIVFHYTSVTIATGATLTFTGHPANPPVVWLVEAAVQVNGVVNLDGISMSMAMNGEGPAGPGGFRGGRHGLAPILGGGGFGPGGGGSLSGFNPSGGGYGSAGAGVAGNPGGSTYGNPAILPLIGGSGGGGSTSGGTSGGGGGGAILIAAQNSIAIVGAICTRGGNCTGYPTGSSGSGGSVRLITPQISGSGSVLATGGICNGGGAGGYGRIRVEANTQNIANLVITPTPSTFDPGDTPQFWPDSATPTVRVASLNGLPVPTDPRAQLNYPWQDIFLDGSGQVTAVLETTNVPTNGTVKVFVTKQGGSHTTLPPGSVTWVGGNESLSTWQAIFTSTDGMFAVQARAVLP